MDLFSLLQPPEDESFYMRMAAMNQMSQMMQNIMLNPLANMGMDPLGIMGIGPQPMLAAAVGVPALRPPVPPNPWIDMFNPGGGSAFQSMSLMGGDANVHSYCSSTLMSMSTGPDGRPVVYQATSSTRSGPGGICETQKSVCDSVSGTKKMQIGRHIGNRGHVIEKEQNYLSGEREEREDFINIDEDDAERFTEEFEYRTRINRGNVYAPTRPQALTSSQASGQGTMLALPSSQTYTPAERSTPTCDWNGDTAAGRSTPTRGWNGDTPAERSTPTRGWNGDTPAERSTPTRGWNGAPQGSTWYPSHNNSDQPTSSCEKIRKRDLSHDEVGGPTSCKTQKTYLPNYENVD